jgi:hypothetical protein
MTAPTGKAREMRNFAPEAPPRPRLDILIYLEAGGLVKEINTQKNSNRSTKIGQHLV